MAENNLYQDTWQLFPAHQLLTLRLVAKGTHGGAPCTFLRYPEYWWPPSSTMNEVVVSVRILSCGSIIYVVECENDRTQVSEGGALSTTTRWEWRGEWRSAHTTWEKNLDLLRNVAEYDWEKRVRVQITFAAALGDTKTLWISQGFTVLEFREFHWNEL